MDFGLFIHMGRILLMASISSVSSHIDIEVEVVRSQRTNGINIGSTEIISSVVDGERRADRHIIVVPKYLCYYPDMNCYPYQTSKLVW